MEHLHKLLQSWDPITFEIIKINLLFLFLLSVVAMSCNREFDPRQETFPLIRTKGVTNIDNIGVQFNGEVIKDGASAILDHGFVWVQDKGSIPGPDTFRISLGSDLQKEFSIKVAHKLITSRSYQVVAYATIGDRTVFAGPVNFMSRSTSPPQINSFNPTSVLDGDTLTIFGENLNETAPDDVYINGKLASTINFNQKYVKVVVPAAPQAGPATVLVDAFYAKMTSDKLIIAGPSISSFSPTHASIGQTITLKGRFSNIAQFNKVSINGIDLYVASSNKSALTVYVNYLLSGSGPITITVNGKSFTTTGLFTVD